MSNPWLEIPLEDYEGHMSAPSVAQAPLPFEYVEAAAALATLRRNCPRGGVLVAVLQLPADGQPRVSASAFRGDELSRLIRLPATFAALV